MHPHASLRAGVWLGCLTAGLVLGSGSPATPAEQAADATVAVTAATAAAPAPAAPSPAATDAATPPAAAPPAPAPPPPAEPRVDPKAAVSFERDIRPIFKAYCFDCHGSEAEHKGELDLRLRRLVAKGGESGPAIAPGDATASLLVRSAARRRDAPQREESPFGTDRQDRSLDCRRRHDSARRASRRRAGRDHARGAELLGLSAPRDAGCSVVRLDRSGANARRCGAGGPAAREGFVIFARCRQADADSPGHARSDRLAAERGGDCRLCRRPCRPMPTRN